MSALDLFYCPSDALNDVKIGQGGTRQPNAKQTPRMSVYGSKRYGGCLVRLALRSDMDKQVSI